jgi:hypothetical protein
MTTSKNTKPINLGVQVGHRVAGVEELNTSHEILPVRYEGVVTRVNNGIATVSVTWSENHIYAPGETILEFSHNLTVTGR